MKEELEELSVWLKSLEKVYDESTMASIAILLEIKRNIDVNGDLPAHSRQYIEEKFDIIRRSVKP